MLITMLALTGCNNPFPLNKGEPVPPTTVPVEMVTVYADADGDGYGRTDVNREILEGDDLPSGWSFTPGDCDDSDGTVGVGHETYTDADGDGFAECQKRDDQGACTNWEVAYVCGEEAPEGHIFSMDAAGPWDLCPDEVGDVKGCPYEPMPLVCKGVVEGQAKNAIQRVTGEYHDDYRTVVVNVMSTNANGTVTVWSEDINTAFSCEQLKDGGNFVAVGNDGNPIDANCFPGALGYPVHEDMSCDNIALLTCDDQSQRAATEDGYPSTIDPCTTFDLDNIDLSYVDEPVVEIDEDGDAEDEPSDELTDDNADTSGDSPEEDPDKTAEPDDSDEPDAPSVD